MFSSLFITGELTITTALIATAVSLVLGLLLALTYMRTGNYSKNFIMSIVLLPAIVQVVIMLVNGNLGAGVAVAGTFSLVRFRSYPGNAKEIVTIFLAMAIGLATGMGFVLFAGIFTVIVCIVLLLLCLTKFGEERSVRKDLRIIIPEDLDYTNVFDDLFEKYTNKAELERVKTTNLGSMYELKYLIEIKDASKEKEFIDEIRTRNGNLTVICGKVQMTKEEL